MTCKIVQEYGRSLLFKCMSTCYMTCLVFIQTGRYVMKKLELRKVFAKVAQPFGFRQMFSTQWVAKNTIRWSFYNTNYDKQNIHFTSETDTGLLLINLLFQQPILFFYLLYAIQYTGCPKDILSS